MGPALDMYNIQYIKVTAPKSTQEDVYTQIPKECTRSAIQN